VPGEKKPGASADFYKPRDFPATGPAREQPWLKWPDEGEDDYAHFQCFRDLPPPRRTLENAYAVYTGGVWAGEGRPATGGPQNSRFPVSWKAKLRKWRWRERSSAFDLWREKTQLEAERDGTLEAWKEMGERHAREAMALQQKALERLRSLNPQELSAAEVRQFLVQAATLERLARGASLQDMARVQREKEQEAAQDGYAVITYVDDWRGDGAKRNARNQNSFYGNGQGALPTPQTPTEEKPRAKKPRARPVQPSKPVLPVVNADGGPVGFGAQVSLPGPPPWATGGAAPAQAVHLPGGGPTVAQDDPGHDAGSGGGDPR
jgi:hypothetical protein